MIEERAYYQFYGRRRGKTLRAHHAGLVDDLLPQRRFNPQQADKLKGQPVWLEIGFGGGEHLAYQAVLQKHVNFIGAEPFRNGVAKLLSLIEASQLHNIQIFDDDVRYLLDEMPDAFLERIYVLYPDPWPKKRHHHRRIINDATIKKFHRLLKPQGELLFASDIADYVAWSLDHLSAHGGFSLLSNEATPYENWVETRYEAKARREGRTSRYLRFMRNAT